MCVFKKCCCCVDLRIGAIVIAILNIGLGVPQFFIPVDYGVNFVGVGVSIAAGICLLYASIKYSKNATLIYLVLQMMSMATTVILLTVVLVMGTAVTVEVGSSISFFNNIKGFGTQWPNNHTSSSSLSNDFRDFGTQWSNDRPSRISFSNNIEDFETQWPNNRLSDVSLRSMIKDYSDISSQVHGVSTSLAALAWIPFALLIVALVIFFLLNLYFWICVFSFYKGLKGGEIISPV